MPELTCLQCIAKQAEIDQANARAEVCELEKAASLVAAVEYQQAAVIYNRLREIRQLEISRKKIDGSTSKAEGAELHLLNIKFGQALMLKQKGEFERAEDLMTEVFEGRHHRAKILGSMEFPEVNLARQELCLILRVQNTSVKQQKAVRLYSEVWDDHDPAERFTADDSWIIENGYELGQVLVEQKLYDLALSQHKIVLNAKQQAFEPQSSAILQSALQIALIEVERGCAKDALETVKKYFLSESCHWTPEILSCATRVGIELCQEDNYDTAEPILDKAWTEAIAANDTNSVAAFNAGWWLSWSLYRQNSPPTERKAKAILQSLLSARKEPSANPGETLQINSLLAWICYEAKETLEAQKYADEVWTEVQDKYLLGEPSYSMGALLIRILFRSDTHRDRGRCMRTWNTMWTAKEAELESCSHEKTSHSKLKVTAQSWETLAKDLNSLPKVKQTQGKFKRKVVGTSELPQQMRLKAKQLKRHCERALNDRDVPLDVQTIES